MFKAKADRGSSQRARAGSVSQGRSGGQERALQGERVHPDLSEPKDFPLYSSLSEAKANYRTYTFNRKMGGLEGRVMQIKPRTWG